MAAPCRRAARGQGFSHRVRGPTDRRQSAQTTRSVSGGLRELGYQEGRNIVIDFRWADGHYDRLPALFAEMVRLNVDVIVTHGTPGGLAAKRATTTIPIVFATAGDAVASGLVMSLARPGGNLTGSTYFIPELSAKQLELLKEVIPGLTDVAILLNPANPMNEPVVPAMKQTAQSLKVELHQFGISDPAELEGAFAAMAARRVGALVAIDDATLIANAALIASPCGSVCRRAAGPTSRSQVV
ncbi:MAG: ABC transporter substrate-binding protein [Xanthobacteraceae bacterium]